MAAAGDDGSIEVRLLGDFGCLIDGARIEIGSLKQRTLLALLACAAPGSSSQEGLMEDLWDGRPPKGARATLQAYVSTLRKTLGSAAIVTTGTGYALSDDVRVDVHEFRSHCRQAESLAAQGRLSEATAEIGAAISLWTGDFGGDVALSGSLLGEQAALAELRARAEELSVEFDLDRGAGSAVIARLREARRAHPLDGRFVHQLMRALASTGRNAAAVREFQEYRHFLGEEVGLEPTADLHELEAEILSGTHVGSNTPATAADEVPRFMAAPVPPDNLLVGREDALVGLRQAAKRSRLVSLVGPGGVGKSRVLLEYLHGDLEGPLLYVAVDRLEDGESVLADLVRRMGVLRSTDEIDPLLAAQRLDGLDITLALDNCENRADEVVSLVSALLENSADISIITTARTALGCVGEHVVNLGPLDVQGTVEAVAMLRDRVVAAGAHVGPDFDRGASRICRAVDGIPLALELVAPLVARVGVDNVSPRSLGDLHVSEEQTFDALVSWSWDELADHDRRLVWALALLRGSFSIDMARSVATAAGCDVSAGIPRLVAASLVTRHQQADGTSRFRLLEPVRRHCIRVLGDPTEDPEVVAAYVHDVADVAAVHGPDTRRASPERWVRSVTADVDNLRHGLRLAMEHHMVDPAFTIIDGFQWHHYLLGEADALAAWVEQHIATDTAELDDDARAARAISRLALAFHRGRYDTTAALSADAVTAAEATDNADRLAEALSLSGASAVFEGDVQRAAEAFGAAEDICVSSGHLWGLAYVDLFWGVALRRSGDYDTARDRLQRADEGLLHLGDLRGRSMALNNLARLDHVTGALDEAAELCAAALRISHQIGDDVTSCLASITAGRIHVSADRLDDAAVSFTAALMSAVAYGNRVSISSALEWIGFVASQRGEHRFLATVDGFTDAFRRAPSTAVPRPEHEVAMARARELLGDRIFEACQHRGAAMTLEQVLDLATDFSSGPVVRSDEVRR